MSGFSEDDIKRTGLPVDVMGLLHDLCYHVNNNLRGTMDEVAENNYVCRARKILKSEHEMILESKWLEFCEKQSLDSQHSPHTKEIFYAGAQAGIDTIPIPPDTESHDIQKEIDLFIQSIKVLL